MKPIAMSLAAIFGAFVPTVAWAQANCQEPRDEAYVESITLALEAIESTDFEAALGHLAGAHERSVHAVVEYSSARALNNLDRLAEAEHAYNRFIRRFEGCPDPDRFIVTVWERRSLAVQQRTHAVEESNDESEDAGPAQGAVSAVVPRAPQEVLELSDSSERRDRDPNTGWFVVGGGASLLQSGLIYDLSQAHLLDDKQAAHDASDVEEYNRLLANETEPAYVVDYLSRGTGAVAVAVGSVLLSMDPLESEVDDGSIDAVAVEGGGLLRYRMAF